MTSLVQELAEAAAETAPTVDKRGMDMEKGKKKEKITPYKNKKTLTVYLVQSSGNFCNGESLLQGSI